MLTKNIEFKNLKIGSINKKINKDLEKLLNNKSEVLK